MSVRKTVLSCALCAAFACASEVQTGAVAFYYEPPYHGMDGVGFVFPFLIYRDDSGFYFEGLELGYESHLNDALHVKLFIAPTLLGYSASKSDALEGMDDREFDIASGISLEYVYEQNRIEGKATYDFFDIHGGYALDLKYSYTYALNQANIVEPYVGMHYLSKAKSSYYYGVEADEVRAGRPRYALDDAINPYAGVKTVHHLGGSWFLMANAEQTFLDKEVTDSPIIEHNHYFTTYIAGVYQW